MVKNIKVISTKVRQVIQIEIPEGWVYDNSKRLDINGFTEQLLVPIVKMNVTVKDGE